MITQMVSEEINVANRISAHKFYDENDLTFCPNDYSRFKFGCRITGKKFGKQLFDTFVKSEYFEEIKNIVNESKCRIIVLSSPYLHVPTATFTMKDFFIRHLNNHLMELGMMPVKEAKIYRASSYSCDYGKMCKQQRYNTMTGDTFHADKSLLDGNVCLFLDDIVITGAHEHRIMKMIKKFKIKAYNYFLYFAELMSHDVDPVIENYLNYHFVNNLSAIDKIIKDGNFIMNTRMVKYVLDAELDDCKEFLSKQTPEFIEELYYNAIGNNYHNATKFKNNFTYLKNLIK